MKPFEPKPDQGNSGAVLAQYEREGEREGGREGGRDCFVLFCFVLFCFLCNLVKRSDAKGPKVPTEFCWAHRRRHRLGSSLIIFVIGLMKYKEF